MARFLILKCIIDFFRNLKESKFILSTIDSKRFPSNIKPLYFPILILVTINNYKKDS